MENNDRIDFRRLEKELASAIEADARYQRENNAKFRAVEQRVGSYEEFRDIVAASHLKPLDRKDITGEKERIQPWNLHATRHSTINKNQNEGIIPNEKNKLPQTAHDFTRQWRRLNNTKEDKYKFLCEIGGELMTKIFKAEISLGLLGEFVEIISGCWSDSDSVVIFGILSGLAKSNRFNLTLQFLSSTEKHLVVELFKKMCCCCTNKTSDTGDQTFTSENIVELARTYGVYL